jgi:phosphoribosylformylglycinamidine synthase
VYWQFVGSIKGMKKACEKFMTPVTGGNVSFYNQSKQDGVDVPVFPTPTIGMMGIMPNKENITTLAFQNEGDQIYLIGKSVNDIASSEYLYSYCGVKNSPAPHFNLEEEFKMQARLKKLIKEKMLISAHDCSDGGLFITLLESAMPNSLGFEVTSDSSIRRDAFLFGEAQSRVVVSVSKEKAAALELALKSDGIEFLKMGEVKSTSLIIDGENFGEVEAIKKENSEALEKKLQA